MNRIELYNKAVELRAQSGPVGAMLTAIDEANVKFKNALGFIRIFAADSTYDDSFHANNADAYVKYAIAYATAGAKLDTLFLTLAVLLEQMGIEVNY